MEKKKVGSLAYTINQGGLQMTQDPLVKKKALYVSRKKDKRLFRLNRNE